MTNIFEIIKEMPKGRKLYCPILGETEVTIDITDNIYPISTSSGEESFTKEGKFYDYYEDGECVLFPSKECRNWSKWALVLVEDGDLVLHKSGRVVRFDHHSMEFDDIVRFASEEEAAEQGKKDALERIVSKTNEPFKPFDKVIVCDGVDDNWMCSLFSHYDIGNKKFKHITLNGCYVYCLPFEGNEHLLGQQFKEEHLK